MLSCPALVAPGQLDIISSCPSFQEVTRPVPGCCLRSTGNLNFCESRLACHDDRQWMMELVPFFTRTVVSMELTIKLTVATGSG